MHTYKRYILLSIAIMLAITLTFVANFFGSMRSIVLAAFPENVHVASDGSDANNDADAHPSISADGRFVAFVSFASNLIANDTNGKADVFVRDRQTGTTELVSSGVGIEQANKESYMTSISADGRYIAFNSLASNLVSGDTNNQWDTFVRDRQTGTTELVSIATDGSQLGTPSFEDNISISADGRYVAWNTANDVYVRDRQTNSTDLISVAVGGGIGNHRSRNPSVTADGRFVAFVSFASNLVSNDANGQQQDVFLRDRQTGTTELVNNGTDGSQPSISTDGRYIVFGTNGGVRIRDRQNVTTVQVSTDGNDTQPSISADGRYIVYSSNDSNQMFIYDVQTGSTKLILSDSDNSQLFGRQLAISADGQYITFKTTSDILVTQNPFLRNNIPIAEANGPYNVNEGSTISLLGTGTDSDNDPLTYVWDLDNNGTFETSGQNPTYSAVGKDGPSTQTVNLQVCDTSNECDTDQATVNITNVAPVVSNISVSVNPVLVNASTTASSSFTDPAGSLDAPYTVEWNWGDGNIETETVSTPGSLSRAHIYTTEGVYEITLTVTDKDSGVGTQSFQYISVYSPTPQGLFSAGNKYISPTGALVEDPSASGNVMFGLSYKYQGDVPVGNRQFTMDFKTSDFEFNATTITSLVISNGVGTLRGTGTITDRFGEFDFLVVGNEDTDKIRIKITDPSNNNAIIYDTQPGDSDITDPETPVTAGSILAH
jgi:Tol biopolymer transport system component